MKAGYVQNNPQFGCTDANCQSVEALLADVDIDLIVLPELFATGYVYTSREELETYAEVTGRGPITTFLQHLAETKRAIVIGGFAERSGDKIYNAADLVTPDGHHRTYRKVHLFDREKELFDKSTDGFWVQQTTIGVIGVMICFDWYFPESIRTLSLAGADVIAHPSNLVLPHCPVAMKTRALENRVFTITANRIGSDQRPNLNLAFIGQSRIYSPVGEQLAGSSSDREEVCVVDIDPTIARNKSVTSRNDLFLDRRTDMYRL